LFDNPARSPFRDAAGRAILGIGCITRDATKRFEEMKSLRKVAASSPNREKTSSAG
jgi:hypothetical protein